MVPFAREVVAKLRSGILDGELIYSKRLRKSTREYIKTTPPHVQAARKAGRTHGVIHYVITLHGPQIVEARKSVPSGIDYDHYVNRVLRPIADSILSEVNEDFSRVLGEPSQLSLL
jgi:DNA polymerase elongation subunit (family B)